MKRPSRGLRESVTTMRYTGCFFRPTRRRRILTAMVPCSFETSVTPLHRAHRASGRSGPHPGLTLPAERHPGRPALLLHALHRLLHVAELIEQAIHFADRAAGAFGDAQPSRPINDTRCLALGVRHREHDRFGVLEPFGIELGLLEHRGVDAEEQLEQSLERAEALDL